MITPTQRVTRNAREYLQDDVVIALRVDWGPEAISARKKFGFGYWVSAYIWAPISLPILAIFRNPELRRMRADPDSGTGILALTGDDRRILLSASPARRKTPTGVVEVLPNGAPLIVDVGLMESDLIPSLTVGDREFVVDGVDFRALMKAVEAHRIRSPEIKAVLPRLQSVGDNPYTGIPHGN